MSFSKLMMAVCSGLLLVATAIGTVGYYFLVKVLGIKFSSNKKSFTFPLWFSFRLQPFRLV